MSSQHGYQPRQPNRSCDCHICKTAPARAKQELHKNYGWRRLRRRSKHALHTGNYDYQPLISTGTKS